MAVIINSKSGLLKVKFLEILEDKLYTVFSFSLDNEKLFAVIPKLIQYDLFISFLKLFDFGKTSVKKNNIPNNYFLNFGFFFCSSSKISFFARIIS